MYYNRYNNWYRNYNNGYNPYNELQKQNIQHMLQDDLIRKHIALNMLNDGIASNDSVAIMLGLSSRYL